MRRRESTYVKLLVFVALGVVLTSGLVVRPWLSLLFPAVGVLFAAGGAAAAARLDAAGSGRSYLRRAGAGLLVPFWAFGGAVVTAMALDGWQWDPAAGSAPLTWSTAWRWLVPLVDPPVSTDGFGLVGELWFVRVLLWLLLLTPPLLWLSRRWPLRLMTLPLLTMLLVTVGIVNPLGHTADVLLGLCAYTGCWLLGFAHHDGRLREVPADVALAVGTAFAAAGVGLALWQQHLHGTYGLEANPAAATLFSLGGVLVLFRLDPCMRGLERIRGLRPVLSLFHGRTLTAFLWVNVVIALTPPALAATPLARFHTPTVSGALLEYAAAWVLLVGAMVLLGWLEDVGAGRRPRLLLRRRRRVVAPAVPVRPEVAVHPDVATVGGQPTPPDPGVPEPASPGRAGPRPVPWPRVGGHVFHGNAAVGGDGPASAEGPQVWSGVREYQYRVELPTGIPEQRTRG